ncbi:Ras-related protein Rab [Acrasis kona]|uniref:Ras-related protein Rab n=1 Tax=Acrasis kona TaxID=1008807 RepID=A0AAW2Z6B6_9EUKA
MKIDTEARLLKIVLLGDSKVGKTALASQYNGNPNTDPHKTIQLDIHIKNVEKSPEEKLMIQIWDTAGDDSLRAQNSIHSFLLYSDLVLLIFDVTEKSSFDNLMFHLESIRNHAPHAVPIILVGNKTDLKNRCIDALAAEKYAKEIVRCPYVEVNIKNPQTVDKLFEKAISDALDNINKPFKALTTEKANPTTTPKRKSSFGMDDSKTPTINVEEVKRKVSDVQATVSGWFGRLQEVLFE